MLPPPNTRNLNWAIGQLPVSQSGPKILRALIDMVKGRRWMGEGGTTTDGVCDGGMPFFRTQWGYKRTDTEPGSFDVTLRLIAVKDAPIDVLFGHLSRQAQEWLDDHRFLRDEEGRLRAIEISDWLQAHYEYSPHAFVTEVKELKHTWCESKSIVGYLDLGRDALYQITITRHRVLQKTAGKKPPRARTVPPGLREGMRYRHY